MTNKLSPAAKWMLKWHILWNSGNVDEKFEDERSILKNQYEQDLKIINTVEKVVKETLELLDDSNSHTVQLEIPTPYFVGASYDDVRSILENKWFSDIRFGELDTNWVLSTRVTMSTKKMLQQLLREEKKRRPLGQWLWELIVFWK